MVSTKLAKFAALILGGAAVASWGNAAEWTWRHLPQFPLDQRLAPVYLDLDGDGANEIVLRSAELNGLTGVLKQSGDGLDLVDIHLEGLPYGHFVPIPAGNGKPARLIVPSWNPLTQSGRLTELTGVPLLPTRQLVLDGPARPWFHGDVDGDGESEIVEFDGGLSPAHVRVLDYATGELRWSYQLSSIPFGSVAALQLDDDPALEIIVVGSQPGLILDGASGTVEWSHAAGFGSELHAGRFAEDLDVPTFATRGASVQVFRGEPYARLNEFTVSFPGFTGPGSAHDVDGDGREELVLAPPYVMPTFFRAFDMRNGQVASTWPSAFTYSTPAAFGRLEPAAPMLLTHGSSLASGSGSRGVQSKTFPADVVQYDADVKTGPFNTSAAADVDGDGQKDIVMLVGDAAVVPPAAAIDLLVFSSAGTLPSASRAMPFETEWLTVADLDGAIGEEVVVANPNHVRVLDGLSLQTRWERRFEFQSDLYQFSPVALSSADFDGDGIADVAMLVNDPSFGNRVVALSGLDGQTLWISLAMPGVVHERSLLVAQLDHDPAMEVVVASQITMHMFDSITKERQWTMQPSGWELRSASLVGNQSNCRLGLLGSGLLRLYDCHTRILVDSIPVPWTVDVVRQVDGSGNFLVYSHYGRLHGLKRAGSRYFRYPMTRSIGASLPAVVDRMVWSGDASGSALELLVGTTGFPALIRLDPSDAVWRGDFEH
jgi:hypothetical protein